MKNILLIIILFFLSISCEKVTKFSKEDKATFMSKGKEIGKATVKKLGSNLMEHMKKGGSKAAIPFCNINANPLTNKVAEKFNVTIKRTSHKLRNEENKPNVDEERILNLYLANIQKGKKLKPMVEKDSDGKVHFYAPMKLDRKCLACHGSIEKTATDSIIKSLYPNDKAIGFNNGDFRGILSVTFNE